MPLTQARLGWSIFQIAGLCPYPFTRGWTPVCFSQLIPSRRLADQLRCSCVFYGDLYPNDECYDASTAQGLGLLLRARKNSAYGPSKDYLEHRSCIGFVRMGDNSRGGCVVLISNGTKGTRCVRIIIVRSFRSDPTLHGQGRTIPFYKDESRGGRGLLIRFAEWC
jgi:hypothetical protein